MPVWNASGTYSSDLFASKAGEWIAQHGATRKDKPMFLYFAFQGPSASLCAPAFRFTRPQFHQCALLSEMRVPARRCRRLPLRRQCLRTGPVRVAERGTAIMPGTSRRDRQLHSPIRRRGQAGHH